MSMQFPFNERLILVCNIFHDLYSIIPERQRLQNIYNDFLCSKV